MIETLIRTALSAFGAHMQPWHFAAVSDPGLQARIREAAEVEERKSYEAGCPTSGKQRSRHWVPT